MGQTDFVLLVRIAYFCMIERIFMAKTKSTEDPQRKFAELMGDIRSDKWVPLYLLTGAEPYFTDKAAAAIIKYALPDEMRDFNQTILYGMDTTVEDVTSAARMYPVMSERRLVVVKDAQSLRNFEDMYKYCEEPLDSTVLVLLFRGEKAPDKRRSLYKNISKKGFILESQPLRDYEMPQWIVGYFQGRGLSIDPEAAALLAEYAGTDMSKIEIETDKLLKNLPEGRTSVTSKDIENNVGISREYSIFELTKALSFRDGAKALRIASGLGRSAKFAMPPAVAMLFTHFYRILKYEALLEKNPRPTVQEKTAVLGVAPFFFGEYDTAVRSYPVSKCRRIISLLEEYDYKGKGGDGEQSAPEDLLVDLVVRILA